MKSHVHLLTLLCLVCLPACLDESDIQTDTPAVVDADNDGFVVPEDCDDSKSTIHPGAEDVCDGIDNNCNDEVDEGSIKTFYGDKDGDDYGVDTTSTQACLQPEGYSELAGDCDDSDTAIHPDAEEGCNGKDNNCDGEAEPKTSSIWYVDADLDGYGNQPTEACQQPSGTVSISGDCNDNNGAVHPGAQEFCDGIDNNCNGDTDDACWDLAKWDVALWGP